MDRGRYPYLVGFVAVAATFSLITSAIPASHVYAQPLAASEDEVVRAALDGVADANAGNLDDDVLSPGVGSEIVDTSAHFSVESDHVVVPGMSISLPVDTELSLDASGVAVGVDSDAGLGVAVVPVEGGGARIVSIAEESFSETPRHEYSYTLDLAAGLEARQLSDGTIAIIDTATSGNPALSEPLHPDVDLQAYEAGWAAAAEGVGADDPLIAPEEVVVGGFLSPWSVDADGRELATHFELHGDQLVQVVDTTGATFPVVSDPAPLIVVGLGLAAKAFVSVAARAFVTTTIRAGAAMTTRGGFTSFQSFKTWAGSAKPNHQWHHIVEQSNTRFPALAIHNPQNLIQIPTAIHQCCINSWMARKHAGSFLGIFFSGTSTVRSQVHNLSWQQQHRFGVELLRYCGVNL